MKTPATKALSVADLVLDLRNFRTVPQPDEVHAINAIIAVQPERFWALMESLLEDGYSHTENIIVLKSKTGFLVKEGNRRIASLKLIHGQVEGVELPDNIASQIQALSDDWLAANSSVPCAIYPESESAVVDKLVARTHGKGEAAGRAGWLSVATARFGRDVQLKAEPGLDLLESYLTHGKNWTPQQAERWAGDFPLTVLNEAIQKICSSSGLKAPSELVAQYPKKNKKGYDALLHDIGISNLGFKEIRKDLTWIESYGFKCQVVSGGGAKAPTPSNSPSKSIKTGGSFPTSTSAVSSGKAAKSIASNDPKSVRKALRQFSAVGTGREKVATLLEEIRKLDPEDVPHAFCFVLRSIFELSAKAYCKDKKKHGGPDTTDGKGNDRKLVDVLRDITNFITKNNSDLATTKRLHGAMTELAKSDGLLSVTSLNALIHHPSFSVAPKDICVIFGNIFPLLEELHN